MEKIKVGVVIDICNTPTNGGSFSYYNTLLNGINNYAFNDAIEIINIVFYTTTKPVLSLQKSCLFIKVPAVFAIKEHIRTSNPFFFTRILKKLLPVQYFFYKIKNKKNRDAEKILMQNKIDFLYYLRQNTGELNYPFIINHWDIGHKSMYPFPEVAMNNNYEAREQFYDNFLSKALLILCESKAGREELINYYSYYKQKIKILPIFASDIINLITTETKQNEILAKFNVEKNNFFIYPAQFWAHKNHYNLILAFKELVSQDKYKHLKLVLSGSDKGNLSYIQETISLYAIEEKVLLLGFISSQELNALYANATALVMPSFLGPTNMPLIEAAHIKCPVLCSNFDGHQEIMGNNAIYFDPANKDEIKMAMEKIIGIDRNIFVEAAYNHIINSAFNLNKSLATLNDILLEIISIRKTWGINSSNF